MTADELLDATIVRDEATRAAEVVRVLEPIRDAGAAGANP